MTAALYRDLKWLRTAPADFTHRCRQLLQQIDDPGPGFRSLAQHALDEAQLHRLSMTLASARQSGFELKSLTGFRLGIISNATTAMLASAISGSAPRYGLCIDCVEADFGQTLAEALSPQSTINCGAVDAVLVAIDYRGWPLQASAGDEIAENAAFDAALQHLHAITDGIHANSGAVCILQTLAAPPEDLFGNLDRALQGTQRRLIERFNQAIVDHVASSDDLLLDVAAMASMVGTAEWHDATAWHMAKLPFAGSLIPFYADRLCRIPATLRGRSRRCLVLDLDNTLWGGVIGDDGLSGIIIGQGDPTGEAHLSVQQTARMLKERGIVLAVSSKNNDSIAREPFRQHPDMLLHEEDIAVFQANWDDKASNLRAIASELSLGLDALVLLDDNPAERQLVHRLLPEVAVPELPDDPALFARTLLAAGYFEATAFLPEDRQRADYYRSNARRVAAQRQTGDLDGYLASLDMVISFEPFTATGRARITQLINKSNQYNLMTRRYDARQIECIEQNDGCFSLQVRLTDLFGDNGMISVVICRQQSPDEWEIDTWLMSCRVLARRVEHAVLNELLLCARERGIRRLIGLYQRTSRNGLVEDHYAKLGFSRHEDLANETSVWFLDVDDAQLFDVPMHVRRLGYDISQAVPAI